MSGKGSEAVEGAGTDGGSARSDGRPKPRGMDYFFGTKEGRSRLLIIIWLISLAMTAAGFVFMAWIFFRGGF